MTFYICTIVLTWLLMLAMAIHVVFYRGFSHQQKTWYLLTFASVAFCSAAELLSFLFEGRGQAVSLPLTVLTTVQFSLSPMLPVFFAGALGMRKPAKIAALVFSLGAAAEIVSAPFGWIFRFDENGVYIHGPAYIIYQAFYFISLVFLIVSMIAVGKRFRKRDVSTIVFILAIMTAGILQMLIFKAYTDYPAIGICAALCYIYYNDLVQQDALADLVRDQKKVREMQEKIIEGMANLIESRSVEPEESAARIRECVGMIAKHARESGKYGEIDDRYIALLSALAPMHDVGMIVVSDELLGKPERLTPEEFEKIKVHSSAGNEVIRKALNGVTDESVLTFASDIVTYHHERWDGGGYPAGLSGAEIPLSARITAISDVFVALTSDRSWRGALPAGEAIKIIADEAGSHFDPDLAKIFLDHLDELR